MINPANYKFGTTSICRVPLYDRDERQINAQDPTTGCMGCASGKGAGPKNIFGNKYGQNLAAVQIARERREEAMKVAKQEEEVREQQEKTQFASSNNNDAAAAGEGESETEDEASSDEDDYGPTPAAGIWAGSHKLEEESEALAYGKDEGERHDGDDEGNRLAKKVRRA